MCRSLSFLTMLMRLAIHVVDIDVPPEVTIPPREGRPTSTNLPSLSATETRWLSLSSRDPALGIQSNAVRQLKLSGLGFHAPDDWTNRPLLEKCTTQNSDNHRT
jgi:hypothetical protein